MTRLIDITGKRFGRLVVRERSDVIDCRGKKTGWICVCDCGNKKVIAGLSLKRGHTKSCGCLSRELTSARSLKHGLRSSPEYMAWNSMKARCGNPKHKDYHNYGGRGIKVHPRWQSFQNFYDDVGPRPSCDLSIDRIDNSRGYEPGNVRWTTARVQALNRRPRKHVKESA